MVCRPQDAEDATQDILIKVITRLSAKSGGGKTFMAQMFLTMMARLNPLISILERGNSYQPLVELMGGRCIDVDLEGAETLEAPLREIFRHPPGAVHAHDGVQRPLPAVGKNPFLLLKVPAALDRRRRPHRNDDADLRTFERA